MRCAVVLAALAATAFAAPSWHLVDSDIQTVDTGVAFVSDTRGYTAGAQNGVGPQAFTSTDGGKTWTQCSNFTFGVDILLLDLDATNNTVVISGVLGELYSEDGGQTFSPSVGGGTSQSVRYLGLNGDGGEKYGVAGTYFSTEGVGLSVDGGKTFKAFDAKLTTGARYGAFPTDTTWYVSAGEWPGEGQDDDPAADDDPMDDDPAAARKRSIRRHRKSVFMTKDGHVPMKHKPRAPAPVTGSYEAQITKTTDGGATWKTVFNVSNQFYWNAIDCQPSNADWCCAVGEADSDSPVAGARIHCTQDGGATWNRTFFAAATNTTGFSLMEIRYANDNEVWAVGGELGEVAPSAWFLYSDDGGLTWAHGTPPIPFWYAIGLSNVDDTHAFAAVINTVTQESGIAAYD